MLSECPGSATDAALEPVGRPETRVAMLAQDVKGAEDRAGIVHPFQVVQAGAHELDVLARALGGAASRPNKLDVRLLEPQVALRAALAVDRLIENLPVLHPVAVALHERGDVAFVGLHVLGHPPHALRFGLGAGRLIEVRRRRAGPLTCRVAENELNVEAEALQAVELSVSLGEIEAALLGLDVVPADKPRPHPARARVAGERHQSVGDEGVVLPEEGVATRVLVGEGM